jgi:hypothetical protein
MIIETPPHLENILQRFCDSGHSLSFVFDRDRYGNFVPVEIECSPAQNPTVTIRTRATGATLQDYFEVLEMAIEKSDFGRGYPIC